MFLIEKEFKKSTILKRSGKKYSYYTSANTIYTNIFRKKDFSDRWVPLSIGILIKNGFHYWGTPYVKEFLEDIPK